MIKIVIIILFAVICSKASAQADSANIQKDSTQSVDSTQSGGFLLTYSQKLGGTYTSLSSASQDSRNFQWLVTSLVKLSYTSNFINFNSSFYLNYGQVHNQFKSPEKTQDNLIVTLTPSIIIIPKFNISLFLETTGETTLTKGKINNQETNFLDPCFFYQTLFLGQTFKTESKSKKTTFDLTYGLGYALEQTLTNKFVLEQNRNFVIDPNNPLSKIQDQFTLESGYSAIFEMNFNAEIASELNFIISSKSIALSKQKIWENYSNSRASSLLLSSIKYKIISIDYNMRLMYDRNLSKTRQLNETMVISVNFDL